MGRTQRKHANNHAVGVLPMIPFFIFALLYHLVYVNPTPGLITTMGITMRALISKDKPTSRAIITTAATPKEQRSMRLAKSHRTINVNPLNAEINLPGARFDNVLEALHPTTTCNITQEDELDDPCGLALPLEKTNQITPLAFPMDANQRPIKASNIAEKASTESPQA
jgi:hypothetical protein